jgi:hypothetical protein
MTDILDNAPTTHEGPILTVRKAPHASTWSVWAVLEGIPWRKSLKGPQRKRHRIGSILAAKHGLKNAGENAMPDQYNLPRDYLVITRAAFNTYDWHSGPNWVWKISRRSKPLGVALHGENFNSEHAARAAGQKALKDLLAGLPKEERNA